MYILTCDCYYHEIRDQDNPVHDENAECLMIVKSSLLTDRWELIEVSSKHQYRMLLLGIFEDIEIAQKVAEHFDNPTHEEIESRR